MDLPNELLVLVLGYLSNQDLKHTRLACKRLSSLSDYHFDLDTVYLSPRSKDMEVFDGITQHPFFSKRVKHVIYDSAQFVHLGIEGYFATFCNQLNIRRSVHRDSSVQDLVDLLHGSHLPATERLLPMPLSFMRFLEDPSMLEGYIQYMTHAIEQRNLFSRTWFARARRGLEAIGVVHSIAVRNTWHTVQDAYIDHTMDDLNNVDAHDQDSVNVMAKELFDDIEAEVDSLNAAMKMRSHILAIRDERAKETITDAVETNRNEAAAKVHQRITANTSSDANDGDQSQSQEEEEEEVEHFSISVYQRGDTEPPGRSPLARSWPSTYLLPKASATPWTRPSWVKLQKGGASDGAFEVLKVIQLLRAANKEPLEFLLSSAGWLFHKGVPPIVFATALWPETTRFDSVCKKVEVLNVRLASYVDEGSMEIFPCLDGLKELFHSQSPLRELSLEAPADGAYDEDDEQSFYPFSQIFAPMAEWQLPNLQSLDLEGFEASFSDLAGLLFINLPQLQHLALGFIRLDDGRWEDIIEGLRRLKNLHSCQIKEDLIYPGVDSYYVDSCYERDDVFLAVSSYNLGGERHPSLFSGEPNEASAKYMQLISTIRTEAKTHPFLYEWTHHPDPRGFHQMQLPHTWIDRTPPYTYQCAITLETVPNTEEDGDNFSFKDVCVVADRIVNKCLYTERGLRPQIGFDVIGILHRPQLVRVYLHSVRLTRLANVANVTALRGMDDRIDRAVTA
ncbi:MAG: hypothetical protein Q9208_004621 [Pyrenodesmia sp. 3 TL-2023]